MNNQIISARQFTIITIFYSIGTTILIIPASIAIVAKQDAWISAILGVAISFLLVKLFITIGNTTPNLTFVEANEKILGKIIGKTISFCFVILTFLSSGELLFFIGNFMKTVVMPETPTVAFVLLFMIVIMFAAYLGIEVFVRSAEMLFPVFLITFAMFVVFISPQINTQNLQPVFDLKIESLIYSIFIFMGIFSIPMIVLLMIYPNAFNKNKSAQKGFYIGTLVGGLVLIVLIFLCILVLGEKTSSSQTFPSYTLAQKISIGNFLQRIEIIMTVMWIITIYIRTFMYFYASVVGLAQILNIKDHRPLILPLGMIAIAVSQIIHPNIVHSDIFNREIFPIWISIFGVFVPLLLLIVAKIRKISGKQANSNTKQETMPPEEEQLKTISKTPLS